MNTPNTSFTLILRYRRAAYAGDGESNRQKLLAALDAQLSGDLSSLTSLFHSKIVFHEAECLPYGGTHHGVEATIAAVNQMFDCYDRMHVEVEDVLAHGELVIVYAHVEFRVRKNGRTGKFSACETYRFDAGKIIEWRVHYFDSRLVAQALYAD